MHSSLLESLEVECSCPSIELATLVSKTCNKLNNLAGKFLLKHLSIPNYFLFQIFTSYSI